MIDKLFYTRCLISKPTITINFNARIHASKPFSSLSEEHEIAMTGKLSPNTHTLPLSILGSREVFELDDDDFENICGFQKPTPDETLVFTCAAGMRSQTACAYAAQAGYTKLVNYMGGAYEWFSGN